MLEQVDHPVLIRSGRRYPELAYKIPDLKITQKTGPRGWNEAVSEILGNPSKGGKSEYV
jgi:hypothetical protein